MERRPTGNDAKEVILGIIGTSPSGARGPVTCRSFKDFQRRLGEIEAVAPGSYWAAHAACHAFVNGIGEIAFAGATDLDDAASVVEAFRKLTAFEPNLSLVVAPGAVAVGPELAAAARSWCRERGVRRGANAGVVLWLDAPDRTPATDIVSYLERVDEGSGVIGVVTPWVETITPGRRSAERLPPSSLVAPLYLRTTDTLRGVHTIETRPSLSDRATLRSGGCGLLAATTDRRRLVHLAFPEPVGGIPEPMRPKDLQDRIREALEQKCEALLDGRPLGPPLWRSLERDARAVMEQFKRSGEIVAYGLRCDEETNMNAPDGVAMEVWIQVPQRVKKLILHVGVRS